MNPRCGKPKSQVPNLPETEAACLEVLTLPIKPSLTGDEKAVVIAAVRGYSGG